MNRTGSRGWGEHILVEPLRDRFVSLHSRGEVTASGLARDLGWYRQASPSSGYRGRVPDGQRVRRALGLRPESSRGRSYHRQHVNYDLAGRLCAALNLDPWEAGL